MHLATPQHEHAGQFGFVCDNTIGGTPQPNPWEDDWVAFFREHRLRHQLRLAGNARLNAAAEPLLRPGALETFFHGIEVRPSVLHGDLWSGNIASAGGAPTIFDPATYYGHSEAEFGMSWCAGFGAAFWAAYHELLPLAPGHEARADLYELYHKLNHYNLFGSGYLGDSGAKEAEGERPAALRSMPELTLVQRVAYQGVPGAYSEIAATKACPDMTPMPCEQFEVAFQALDQWMADRAVLPIENSLGGSIHAVYDLLLRYKMHIVGEVAVPIDHCLMALPGVKKEDIRRVMSHPQALAQTDNYIRRMHGCIKEAVDDTAGAARMIMEGGWRDTAAVASRRAAELYGLDILDESIQDMEDNVTRFVVLSRDPAVNTAVETTAAPYKTSIVFSMQEAGLCCWNCLCFVL
eukprot:scaffold112.g5059.t1